MLLLRLSAAFAGALLLANAACTAAELKLDRDNLAIAGDTIVAAGRYQVVDTDKNGVLHVRGNNLVIDFQHASLRGSAEEAAPNEFQGRAVVIEDSADVVLKNTRIRGFKTRPRMRRLFATIVR